MPIDFKAKQIRTAQLIATGSSSVPSLLVYGSKEATNEIGGYSPLLISGAGTDTFVFISGSVGSKNTINRGTAVFGGDVVISGTIYNGAGASYSTGGGGGGGGDVYWTSPTAGSIFTTGSASATFLSSSIGLQVTGSVTTSGSFSHIGQLKVSAPDEGTINLYSSVGNSVLTHVSDGNLYLTNNNNTGEVVLGATNSGGIGKQLIRLNAGSTTGNVYLSGSTYVGVDATDSLYVNAKLSSDVIPDGNRTRNLGSDNFRFANIYTGDLHLRNERGNWTIVEEEDYLCVVNNLTGKRYKMMLQPLD